jgi:hypothetical protein
MGENNILIRTAESSRMISAQWWNAFIQGAGRDQISLPRIVWGKNLRYGNYPFNVRELNGFQYMPHTTLHKKQHIRAISRYLLFVPIFKIFRTIFRF